MANTKLTLSLPADAAERLRVKLATMTPEQINEAFGVEVLSVKFPEAPEEVKYVEDDLERDRRVGKRG